MDLAEDDVDDLAAGATLLGSGGGGDTAMVAAVLRHALAASGPVRLVDAAGLPPGALVVPVAATGGITVMIERLPSGEEFVNAVRSLGRHVGRPVTAVHGFECGGANALFAVAAAVWTGLPLVDADGMGRAYPRVDQVTFNAGGLSATPAALADPSGNELIISGARDNADAERMLRAALPALGGWAATAIYPMRAADAARCGIAGSISGAVALGRRLREAQGDPGARAGMLADHGAGLLFTGTIVEVLGHPRPRTGGALTVEHHADPRRTLRVEFADEYLLAIDDGEITAQVPDIIALLDGRSWRPVAAEHVTAGRHVDVVRFPAPAAWSRPAARRLVTPDAFGLRVPGPGHDALLAYPPA
ncbi:hypothetical protein Nocox_23775 [Nonomuraea coxensis DSM 45129]|uniref:DUF917 domain-containing protein n=1 Tax=Nonomuraea coxensis DSM 45129 TaxID=1122611 RepID=A0ABX8U6Q7_9ACTN|nr:DUF917 domain-containing protein [Nonomuraea coxensis]QYC42358.1 hypothetical protein Nocox_23775 [Nonomuraea coxensis DSM 45129]